MTHTAHTPGPWTLASRQLIVTDNAWRTPIAICHDNKSMVDGVSQQESDSNARLIAAAPDLLEEGRKILEHIDRWKEMGGNLKISKGSKSDVDIEAFRAAISKARGQSSTQEPILEIVDETNLTAVKYTRAESVPSEKERADIVDKAYIFLCNKLNDYQAKDSSRPSSFYTDLKPSMLWAVEYLAKEGYIKTAPDQSEYEAVCEDLGRAHDHIKLYVEAEEHYKETIKALKEALEKSNEHLERILLNSIKIDSDHAPSPLSNQILSNREALALAKGE